MSRGTPLIHLGLKGISFLAKLSGFGKWDYCLGPNQPGEREIMWIGFPLYCANRVHTAKSWDSAPGLGPLLDLPAPTWTARPLKYELGKVYTVCHWSMYIDLMRWQLPGIPGIGAVNIKNVIGDQHFYMSIWLRSMDSYYFKARITNALHAPKSAQNTPCTSRRTSMEEDSGKADPEQTGQALASLGRAGFNH